MFLFLPRITKGTEYTGKVKEKEEAKKEYDRAKSRGQSAGHIVAKYVLVIFVCRFPVE